MPIWYKGIAFLKHICYSSTMNYELNNSQENKTNKLRIKNPKRFGAAVLLATSIFAGGLVHEFIDNDSKKSDFSEETKPYFVESGDGLNDAAAHIDNINKIDIRLATHHIKNMPENEAVLADGLQPGEVVITPVSVK